MTYRLHVVKNMALVDYNERLAVSRSLQRLMAREGIYHGDRKSAVKAAQVISQHVLVEYVKVTRETQEGRWRNGTTD